MPVVNTRREDVAALRKPWLDPGVSATTLFVAFVDLFIAGRPEPDDPDDAPLSWAPETIVSELSDRLGMPIPSRAVDRLMAAIMLVKSDDFYESVPSFISICNVLSGSHLEVEHFDPADAGECAWGITEAMLLAPPAPDDPEPFSDEVRTYVGHVLDMEGIITPPDVLRIGIRSKPNTDLDVSSDWSDDPEMFAAIRSRDKDRGDDLRALLRERLSMLLRELESLPLVHGQTAQLVQRLAQTLEH